MGKGLNGSWVSALKSAPISNASVWSGLKVPHK